MSKTNEYVYDESVVSDVLDKPVQWSLSNVDQEAID